METNEVWKEIPGTEGMIEVSNFGRIRSLLRGYPYVLKCQKDKKGYLRIHLTLKRKRISYKLHREVAKVFIPNPDNLPQVNHKDGNKENNAVSNLEWCSNKDNARHAIENGLWESVFNGAKHASELQRKPIIAEKDGIFIEFDSICDAQSYFNTKHIIDVLKGRRSHAKGWHFSYAKGVAQ